MPSKGFPRPGRCLVCDVVYVRNAPNAKYCPKCVHEVEKKQDRERKRRMLGKRKKELATNYICSGCSRHLKVPGTRMARRKWCDECLKKMGRKGKDLLYHRLYDEEEVIDVVPEAS